MHLEGHYCSVYLGFWNTKLKFVFDDPICGDNIFGLIFFRVFNGQTDVLKINLNL